MVLSKFKYRLHKCWCHHSRVPTLSHLATSNLLKNQINYCHLKSLEYITTGIQADAINQLWFSGSYRRLYDFLTSGSRLRKLFNSEWYKTVPLHTINIELYEMGEGNIYNHFMEECMTEMMDKSEDSQEFTIYAPIPLNFILYLVDGGYYCEALRVVEILNLGIEHFISKESTIHHVKRMLNDIHTVALTSQLHCYNMLKDVKKGQTIYCERQLVLSRLQNEDGSLPNIAKRKAAAFLTECSKFCYINDEIEKSHKHVMMALNYINDMIDEEPHPRIIIDALRQATYTQLQLGRRQNAKLSIEAALTLCKHICEASAGPSMCRKCYDLSDSLLFLDCLVDYGFFLGKTDRLRESWRVMSSAYNVSISP